MIGQLWMRLAIAELIVELRIKLDRNRSFQRTKQMGRDGRIMKKP